jgi:S-adenosylmethionine synthetase
MDDVGISISTFKGSRVSNQPVEFVERKGLGHPDYIADSVAEELSRRLAVYYLEEYGTILHHNVDKTLLVGGQANPFYGGGEIISPILIVHAGRATSYVNHDGKLRHIPVGRLAVEATKDWISKNMRYLNPEAHLVVDYKINPGSTDLVKIFDDGKKARPLSNDTSFGVGFAPFTPLELAVYNIERGLNSKQFKSRVPESGEDIKVMGLRRNEEYIITIAAAVLSPLTRNYEHYVDIKNQIAEKATEIAKKYTTSHPLKVVVNTADSMNNQYLTVTGTSAEHGDDGAVGRGNRSNGIITPNRPMSLEAVAGKNPVSHVGKIYNIASQRIAEAIASELGIAEVYVKMLSQIGRPIDEPLEVDVQLLANGSLSPSLLSSARSIAEDHVENLPKITEMLVKGELSVT